VTHLGEVGFLGGRPTVNPEGRLRGGCDATPPPARRIPDPSAKQGYLILQAQSKNDGARVGSNVTAGSLPTSAPCVLTKARRAPRPCRAGSESSWKTWNLTSPLRRIVGSLRVQAFGRSNPLVADTLATAYFANGQVEKALKTQEAMALAKATLIDTGRSAKDRLEQYKKAAKK